MGRYIPIGTFDDEFVDAEELGNEQVAAYDAVGKSAQFQTDWDHDQFTGDQFPKGETALKDSGLGTLDKPVGHLTIGNPTIVDGMQGAILRRTSDVGGGMAVMGLRDFDPQNPPTPPYIGNAYLELNGSAVLVASGGLWLELASAIDKDHELIIGPSVTLADGRHFSPVLVGPEKIYTFFDEATDTRDLDVLDVGEVLIATLTLTNNYAADISTFSFQVLAENNASRATLFDVIIKLDDVEVVRYARTVTGGTLTISDTNVIENALTSGQVMTMFVEATSTHPQSEGWVRGSVQTSRMRVQQG